MTLRPVRVLIVDDSATVRETLTEILSSDPGITVIGTAPDPYVAAKRIQQELPDVITLDVEMPRMDGITFLRKLMEQHPIPVVMCSSLDEHSERLGQAMDAGAVDFILKPKLDTRQQLQDARIRICDTVKAAASVHLKAARSPPPLKAAPKLTADAMLPPPRPGSMTGGAVRSVPRTTAKVICIGASTGGTESLRAVLEVLPATSPGIVIVQHMPEKFTAAFSRRLNDLCAVTVKEAEDGDTVTPGLVLIAPGNHHMLLQRSGDRYFVTVKDGPLVSRHRPSVDVLFRSAAHAAGGNGIGVIMTGMGDDGAKGLLEMRHAGAVTVAQDEESCVVFGMPKEAIQLGAVDKVLPLSQIATQILSLGRQG